jgi:AcrR family transcriptional regulator
VGTKERRSRERHETRERILSAAREMFAEEGFEAVTMRSIADRIEYTPTAIYHHFENKHALLSELCQCDFEKLARHFVSAVRTADPVQRILAVGEAYLQFAQEYPSQYRFMFMTPMPPIEHSPEFLAEHHGNPEKDAYSFLREACRQAIEQGRLRPDITDPDELAQILWASVHGLISLRLTKQHDRWIPWRDLTATARRSMQMFLNGALREGSDRSAAP